MLPTPRQGLYDNLSAAIGRYSYVNDRASTSMSFARPDSRLLSLVMTALFASLFLTSIAVALFAWRRSRQLTRTLQAHAAVEEALQASEQRFAKTFSSSPLPLLVSSLRRHVVLDVNAEFERVTGRGRAAVIGQVFAELHLTDSADFETTLRDKLIHDGRLRNEEVCYRTTDGELRPALCSAEVIEYGGEPAALIAFNDITDRKRLEEQLTHQAFHDPLTGLANRALFRNRVEHALARADRNGRPTAILFLDLDDFKRVNDTLGNPAGDQLLQSVSECLLGFARETDTCARLAGDEFGILMEDMSSREDAVRLAERLIPLIQAPFDVGGTVVRIGVSVGIAIAEPKASADVVLRNADLAMYLSKTQGKGRYTVFEPAQHDQVLHKMELESDLREAMERNEFTLLYQPVAAFASGEIVGIEALVRWQHPTRGMISPAVFIPLAEQSGVILELSRWVLKEACGAGRRLQERYPQAAPRWVSANVSGRHIISESFEQDIDDALLASGLDAAHLVLEITEGVLVHNDAATVDRLWRLKAAGVRLAIDDFGTGYSSLAYLQRFPVDILKIDKSFTDRLGTSMHESPLSRAVVGLGRSLSVTTIAEGIETPAQWTRLSQLGADLGQGYLIARPLTEDALYAMLETPRSASAPTAKRPRWDISSDATPLVAEEWAAGSGKNVHGAADTLPMLHAR